MLVFEGTGNSGAMARSDHWHGGDFIQVDHATPFTVSSGVLTRLPFETLDSVVGDSLAWDISDPENVHVLRPGRYTIDVSCQFNVPLGGGVFSRYTLTSLSTDTLGDITGQSMVWIVSFAVTRHAYSATRDLEAGDAIQLSALHNDSADSDMAPYWLTVSQIMRRG